MVRTNLCFLPTQSGPKLTPPASGRQALSTPSRRALSTENNHTPASFGAMLADGATDPATPPAPNASSAPADGAPAQPATWTAPKAGAASPLALWNRKLRIKLDPQPAKDYRMRVKLAKTTGKLGSTVVDRFDPSSLLRDPPRPDDVTLELLMASQCHMGHHKSLWNPVMQRYIYGVRSDIHIISLEETAAALRRAAKIVEMVAYLGGLMLFVGNRPGQMEVIARAAELAGACHLFTKWIPGTITNRDAILGKETLKIVDHQDKPAQGFERHLLERRPLMPDMVVVLNPLENYTLLQECAQENIPTIGLVDTNGDPTKVTYTIPGNDDRYVLFSPWCVKVFWGRAGADKCCPSFHSLRSVSVIAGVLGRAGEAGQKRRMQDAARGLCTWQNSAEIERWIEAAVREEKAAKLKAMNEARNQAHDGDEEELALKSMEEVEGSIAGSARKGRTPALKPALKPAFGKPAFGKDGGAEVDSLPPFMLKSRMDEARRAG